MVVKKSSKNWRPTPPYAPWSEMQKALEKLRHFRPSKVDIALLQTYGIAPKNERAVINAIKYLGVIDKKGTPTEKLTQLQVKGSEYGHNLASFVREAYADLISRVDLSSALPETIHNYFLAQKVGPSVAPKCSRFFLGLCQEAGLELAPALATPARGERPRLLPRQSLRIPQAGNGARRALQSRLHAETSPDLLEAKIKLFEKLPNFDASWKPEAIELIFREFHRLFDRLEGTEAPVDLPGSRSQRGRKVDRFSSK